MALLALAVNIVLPIWYVFWLFPRDRTEFVLPAHEIKNAILTNSITISIATIMMIYFNDLTGQVYESVRKSNEMTEAATREKESFFATISHEIRNPPGRDLQELLCDRNQYGVKHP